MPRGKRTVFAGYCKECNRRISTIRLHKQKAAKTWKDFKPSEEGFVKFCAGCRKRNPVKLKEEKHSSN
ncbi:MAG TPA: hypothetical protein VJB82_02190 [Candidatus Peribacterales bacterium]|nr:hypothetical protein [Candidatus Peribacterales bacterium]